MVVLAEVRVLRDDAAAVGRSRSWLGRRRRAKNGREVAERVNTRKVIETLLLCGMQFLHHYIVRARHEEEAIR